MTRSLFKDYGGGVRQRPQEAKDMEERTLSYLAEMEDRSVFFLENSARMLASFESKEVECDKMIGMGEFGVVFEVRNIFTTPAALHPPSMHSDAAEEFLRMSKSCGELPALFSVEDSLSSRSSSISSGATIDEAGVYTEHLQHLRMSMSHHVHRDGSNFRYAVKQLRKDLYPKRKCEAAKDLAREAKLLACLEHPNIVRLRATVSKPGHADFMIVLDRLITTLSERVKGWGAQAAPLASMNFPWQYQQRKQQEQSILSERLFALYDVSQAMCYLHRKSIIFRDLKPENVAVNHHGAYQLIDFGLAKEVKDHDRIDGDGLYNLTGLTGTVRIMAPEVLQCQPYGLSADVYSFGVVVWEVFCGSKNCLTAMEICKGQRPDLPVVGMPDRVESVVQKCWSENIHFRPNFAMLCQEVEYQLLELQQQTDEFLDENNPIFNRFDYLRQLSFQSLTATVEPSNVDQSISAVEQ